MNFRKFYHSAAPPYLIVPFSAMPLVLKETITFWVTDGSGTHTITFWLIQDTVKKVKSWSVEKSIISGCNNWNSLLQMAVLQLFLVNIFH